ncbi:MAG: hypothetical protein O7J95_20525 [Planctomycetota bacterium]|nr:hypothetical protein [Planctomycetota bacterium]
MRRSPVFWLILNFLTPGALCGQEGGIEVFAAETLFDQGMRLSVSHLYKLRSELHRGSSRVSDPQDRVFQEHRVVAGFDYGVLPELTLSALVPAVYRELRREAAGGRERLEAFGLGDIALLGKYRLHKVDWERSSFNVSLVAGLEFPSGETGAREDGVRLPPSLQPGSGSWDPFVALASRLGVNRWRFDALAFYKANTEGTQEFEDGDFLALEADVAFRFLHTKYPGPTASARVGLQFRYQGRAEQSGLRVNDSGSDALMARFGLTVHPMPRMDLTVAVDVPLYQDLRGEQLGLGVRTFFALGIRF